MIDRTVHPILFLGLGVIFALLCTSALAVFFLFRMRSLPPPLTQALALADLDGDGDLDAFLANGRIEYLEPNTVLWNDGEGHFQDSGQRPTYSQNHAVALGDVNADGAIDVVAGYVDEVRVWLNDGSGAMQLLP